jgi:hypothetical protein
MEKDLLQIKIDEAKTRLPEEAQKAIDNVDWKLKILEFRESKGFSYTQLTELEIETELLLCGLLSPEEYPKELEKRMGLAENEVRLLIEEMNQKVFQRIKQEIIKISEEKKKPARNAFSIADAGGEEKAFNPKIEEVNKPLEVKKEIMPEDLLLKKETEPASEIKPDENFLASEKLFKSFQIPETKTEHSLEKITSASSISPAQERSNTKIKVDPYREVPE